MMKNPKECICIQKNQTFFVLNELTIPECKDGSEPLPSITICSAVLNLSLSAKKRDRPQPMCR